MLILMSIIQAKTILVKVINAIFQQWKLVITISGSLFKKNAQVRVEDTQGTKKYFDKREKFQQLYQQSRRIQKKKIEQSQEQSNSTNKNLTNSEKCRPRNKNSYQTQKINPESKTFGQTPKNLAEDTYFCPNQKNLAGLLKQNSQKPAKIWLEPKKSQNLERNSLIVQI